MVREWFDAFNRGDGDAWVARNVHPESVVFDDVRIELEDFTQAGGVVVVGMHVTGVGKGSGAPLDFVRWDVYRFRDGKIGSVHLFADRGEAERSAGVST